MSNEPDTADNGPRQRSNKRSMVLLSARIRTTDGQIDVRLRNLSQTGALLEADDLPPVGSEVVFERGETIVPARVAWSKGRRFGIEFHTPIEESELLIHIRPAAKPVEQPTVFRRSGFHENRPLTTAEKKLGQSWVQPERTRPLGE